MPGLDPRIDPASKGTYFEAGWIARSSPAVTDQ
jgi:hypothetical protein